MDPDSGASEAEKPAERDMRKRDETTQKYMPLKNSQHAYRVDEVKALKKLKCLSIAYKCSIVEWAS